MTSSMLMLAMAGGPAGQGPGGAAGMFVPLMILVAIFYFMVIRPQQRKEKERKAMIEQTKSGQRIMFSGGILGTVTNAKQDTLVVKVADGVKIEIARGAVSRVLEKGEKADKDDSE